MTVNDSYLLTLSCLDRPGIVAAISNFLAERGGNILEAQQFDDAETGPWLEKFYTVNENWIADDRRRLLSFARDLLNSDYAGHRLTFQLFAQSPPFSHLLAVYNNYDFEPSVRLVEQAAGLTEKELV